MYDHATGELHNATAVAQLTSSPGYYVDDGVTSSFVMEIPLDGLAI